MKENGKAADLPGAGWRRAAGPGRGEGRGRLALAACVCHPLAILSNVSDKHASQGLNLCSMNHEQLAVLTTGSNHTNFPMSGLVLLVRRLLVRGALVYTWKLVHRTSDRVGLRPWRTGDMPMFEEQVQDWRGYFGHLPSPTPTGLDVPLFKQQVQVNE